MKKLMVLVALVLLSSLTYASEIELSKGRFVSSSEGNIIGPHGLRERFFSVVDPPSSDGYESGWNYNKQNKKKHGLQVYVDGNYMSIEYYENGMKISSAKYLKGKPNGWFYTYNENRKKDGLQYYFDGSYQVVEEYHHGEKIAAGHYQNGKPRGWFYTYKIGKKDGIQKYVDGYYWSIETYKNGKKDGLSGSYQGENEDGWHYTYKAEKQVYKKYYE